MGRSLADRGDRMVCDADEKPRELSREALGGLKYAEEDVREGRVRTLDEVKRELGL